MVPSCPTSTPLAYAAARLTGGCEGYPAGTTGLIAGAAQGCLVFAPDEPGRVARWARPRATLLVPAALVAIQAAAGA
jgi:hypothetical protein